jgi:hypothetical protein
MIVVRFAIKRSKPMTKLSVEKTGQGAFAVLVQDDDVTVVRKGEEGAICLPYASPREAYDAYRNRADDGDHAAWNICYALEDVLA